MTLVSIQYTLDNNANFESFENILHYENGKMLKF